MATVAPKTRKHLSADALLRLVRNGLAHIPDSRLSESDIALADALRSAFAMFSLKAPSLLAFDKERVEGNLHTIYGIARVPCDTHMREILDPVSPKWLRPVFKSVFRQLQRGKALEAMTFLDGHYLLALDGTEYFSSKTIHCASCLQRLHRNGAVTYAHQLLGAAIIHPDQRAVIPLMPEPIVNCDGAAKNDCEGLDHGIGHFMLCEVDSAARAPTPRIPVLLQTSSAASDQKSVPLLSSRQAG